MTEPATWEASDVSVPEVLDALDRLRRRTEQRATRTRVVTLVAVAFGRSDVATAHAATHRLGARHPARVVVIHADHDGPRGIDASVTIDESDGGRLWSEDVVLRAGGAVAGHLHSLVEPFTLPDLPVVVWYVSALPDPDDELLASCGAMVIDSKALGGARPAMVDLAGGRPLLDLSWIRLAPWRTLLAGLFDGAEYRPFLSGVRSATVEGEEGPRALLAGWVRSRLDLPRARVHLQPAGPAALRLAADAGGRHGLFEVERLAGEELLRARVAIDGGPHHEELFPLPDASTARALAEAIGRPERDRVYEQAVASAP